MIIMSNPTLVRLSCVVLWLGWGFDNIYTCDQNKENQENNILKYEEIFGENLKNMKKVYLRFKTSYENKEKNSPGDPLCYPLSLFCEDSNGNKS